MLFKKASLNIFTENKKLLYKLDDLKNIQIKITAIKKKSQWPNQKNFVDMFESRVKKYWKWGENKFSR